MQSAGTMQRNPNNPALFYQGLKVVLANPTHRVRDELDALRLIELMCGPNEAEVALVDEIGERDALVLILLGDRYHEPKIAANQLIQSLFLTHADALCEVDLL